MRTDIVQRKISKMQTWRSLIVRLDSIFQRKRNLWYSKLMSLILSIWSRWISERRKRDCIMGYVLASTLPYLQSLDSEFIPASEARAIFCIPVFCFIILKMYDHHQTAEKSQFISLQPHKKSLIKNTGMFLSIY